MTKSNDVYLLQNVRIKYVGNSPQFWAKGGSGYTIWVDDAAKMTDAECDKIIRETRGTHEWRKWPWEQIDAAAKRTVDMQLLREE